MKERSSFGRVAAILFLLAFVAVLGFRVYDGLSEKITTIEATLVKVEDILSVDGTFIRDQVIVLGKGDDAEYMVENGEKVSVGQGVVISFDNTDAADSYRQLQEIHNSIDVLTYINSITNSSFEGIKLDSLVYSQLESLINDINSGNINKIDKEYITLKQLIVARDAGLFDSSVFSQKIDSLRKDAEKMSSVVNSASDTVVSDYSGYFVYNADGYETVFDKSCISNLSVEFLSEGKKIGLDVPENTIGAVINDFYWYVAFVVTGEQASLLEQKGEINAYIPNISSKVVQFSVERIIREGMDIAIVVLKCPVMNADYLTTRFQTLDVVFGVYEGIKVPVNALHQENGVWGVYCMEGTSVKFKPAKIIYQTENFYLLEMAQSSEKGLYIHDKIVLGGKD